MSQPRTYDHLSCLYKERKDVLGWAGCKSNVVPLLINTKQSNIPTSGAKEPWGGGDQKTSARYNQQRTQEIPGFKYTEDKG